MLSIRACLPAKVCHANKYMQYQANVSMRPSTNKTDREANKTQQSNRKLLGMNWYHLGHRGLTWEVGTSNPLGVAACGGQVGQKMHENDRFVHCP